MNHVEEGDGATRLVSQKLVVALMIALVHPRPIVVASPLRLKEIEGQLERIAEALAGEFDRDTGIFNCNPDIEWPVLESHIASFSAPVLLLCRIDRLSQATQLQLGFALMQPSSAVKEAMSSKAIIFTTKAPSDKLHPFLRRQVLLKQDLDGIDDDESALVELPSMGSHTDLNELLRAIRDSVANVTIVPELLRYVQDIVLYIRTHRLSRVGISTQASEDLLLVIRTLCVLEGRSFATPSSIRTAAKIALPIHVRLCAPEDEPSLQYGGDISTVKAWIKEWDGDVLVDSVLEEVPVPR